MPTSGPNYTGTVANNTSVGTVAWNNPTNAQGNQTTIYSYVDLLNAGAVEFSIKLIKGGVISGNDKSTGATIPTTQTSVNYGGASDLWGLTFLFSDINASNFGVAFAAQEPLAPTISNYLAATNFGFSIPSNGTITGITCSINQLAASAISFIGSTQIFTKEGIKEIKDLNVDDYVLSFNEKTKRCSYQKIKAVSDRLVNKTIKINNEVVCTIEHPFLTETGYVEAKDLNIGTYVFKRTKNKWKKIKIKTIEILEHEQKVHSIQVDKNENYFANEYAVHNVVLVNRYVRVYNFGITVDYTTPAGGATQRRRVTSTFM